MLKFINKIIEKYYTIKPGAKAICAGNIKATWGWDPYYDWRFLYYKNQQINIHRDNNYWEFSNYAKQRFSRRERKYIMNCIRPYLDAKFEIKFCT